MSGQIGVDIRGLDDVQKALGQLEAPASRKMLQKAASAGAREFKKPVQAEAPRRTGTLRKSVSSRIAKRNRPAAVVSARPKVAYYRHFVILGTKPHQIRFPNQKAAGVPKAQGHIRHPGAQANPFIARGYDRGKAAAWAAIEKVVDDYLEAL